MEQEKTLGPRFWLKSLYSHTSTHRTINHFDVECIRQGAKEVDKHQTNNLETWKGGVTQPKLRKTGVDVLPRSHVEDTPSPVLQKYSTIN